MSSRSEAGRAGGMRGRAPVLLAAILASLAAPRPALAFRAPVARDTSGAHELRVCADPNNLPFSNQKREGFENQLAALVARDLGARLVYTWWPQRRGFVRNTLDAGDCDVLIGVPSGYPLALTTRPYYRSTYVFVSRADGRHQVRSLDDPALAHLRIGLHFTGGNSNPPPAHALGRRHIVDNVVAYSLYGDYRTPNPPATLIDAVANGDVDLAIVWGPLAGYFARREPVRLRIVPVSPSEDGPGRSFVFGMAMGVRQGNTALRDRLQRVLDRERVAIAGLLRAAGVPLAGGVARSDARGGARGGTQ